jgi:hypothetical protein
LNFLFVLFLLMLESMEVAEVVSTAAGPLTLELAGEEEEGPL